MSCRDPSPGLDSSCTHRAAGYHRCAERNPFVAYLRLGLTPSKHYSNQSLDILYLQLLLTRLLIITNTRTGEGLKCRGFYKRAVVLRARATCQQLPGSWYIRLCNRGIARKWLSKVSGPNPSPEGIRQAEPFARRYPHQRTRPSKTPLAGVTVAQVKIHICIFIGRASPCCI